MNSPFILNFDKFECNQFWKKDPKHIQTVCRMSAYIRTVAKNKIIVNCKAKSNFEHAEVIALKSIDKKLEVKLIKQYNLCVQASGSQTPTEIVFDFSVRLNRSPCSRCQMCILNKILEIQELIAPVNIRFILFFSFLNCSPSCTEEDTLQELNQWILTFIKNGISVIIGPIIVNRVVPRPKGVCIRKSQKRESINFILQFRKLLYCIQHSIQDQINCDFVILIGRIFSYEDCIEEELKNYTHNNPKFISIFPKDKRFLSELVPKILGIDSTTPLKHKIFTERQYSNSRVRTSRVNGYKNRTKRITSKKKPKRIKEYPNAFSTNPDYSI